MMRPVFLDTSAFFALMNHNDPDHPEAERQFTKLYQANAETVTTDYVLGETYTLLRARGLNYLCPAFNEIVSAATNLHIDWTTPELFGETEQFFLKHADKGYSFTDCLSFIVMKQRKLTEALTTDQHFAQAGFKALLA